ncbi:MAG: DUF4129 domain-containing protein [Leptolyngbyaceae cyanobacterium SU_3_3]|nr:DUF4129 domain-containing protein [Leptolyngbyaceae cyanobacterium SU_3_3]NJR51116.1 DUF4129 domain-containing protein [Leptolyngbyaceae cyanobacterium CSU_1_3]
MAAFEKTNFDWQLQQLSRRVGEWIELRLTGSRLPNVPNSPQWWFPENFLQISFWAIVVFASIWLGWQVWRLASAYLDSANSPAARWRNRSEEIAERDRTLADWMRQMQEYQRQGNYPEACRALYMAMLQHLNDTKLLPHQLSRTDGEYLKIVQQFPQAQAYQTLIRTHEQLCFGNVAISSEELGICQRAYRAIEQDSPRGQAS